MLTEKQFLIGLALKRFNEQYTKSIRVADCEVKSIPLRWGYKRSYEIFTVRSDDNLRLHIHIRFEGKDGLAAYRLEVDSVPTERQDAKGTLKDEVYVTDGTIDPYYMDSGIYKFRSIGIEADRINILLDEFGEELLLENGDQILLEEF